MKKLDRVCIIDNDNILIYGMKLIMSKLDFCDNITVYSNGQEAIEAMADIVNREEMLPSVIFLDLNMPILDGWGFLEDFLKIPSNARSHVAIYIISSSIDPRDSAKSLEYSGIVRNYILKPITHKNLKGILDDLAA